MARMNLNIGQTETPTGVNILSVNIPPQMRKRHKCGIDWIDNATGGEGFMPSSVTMLSGNSGGGKTTMSIQLADALTSKGHIVVYNSGEESKYQVALTCERLNIKHGFGIENISSANVLIEYLEKLQTENPGKQVFLIQDSLQTLDDEKYQNGTTGKTPVTCCSLLASWAKKTFGIVIFVNQVGKNGHFLGSNVVKHAIDGHWHFWLDTKQKSETFNVQFFEVTKNRFGSSGQKFVIEKQRSGITGQAFDSNE